MKDKDEEVETFENIDVASTDSLDIDPDMIHEYYKDCLLTSTLNRTTYLTVNS